MQLYVDGVLDVDGVIEVRNGSPMGTGTATSVVVPQVQLTFL